MKIGTVMTKVAVFFFLSFFLIYKLGAKLKDPFISIYQEKNHLAPAFFSLHEEIGTSLAPNLIFEETFESNTSLSRVISLQTSTKHGFKIVESPVYSGSRSGRFELRNSDPMIHRGKRAELFVVNRTTHKDRWYSFAAYFPAEEYQYDSANELITQWHQGGSPPISLRIANNRFYLRVLHAEKDGKWQTFDLAPVTKDVWHAFVFHITHSHGADALIEIWHNGKKVVNYTGRNHYEARPMPYWKIGIYKAKWNHNTTDSDKRVVYFDNIKVGNEHATYADMAP
jgi:hypothetical protein